MIIKVLFKIEDEQITMLFGDSYKRWQEQYTEYVRRVAYIEKIEPIHAWKSKAAWKGFGGLKWCTAEGFQHELNREDVQDKEPDNPNPRKYADMKFEEMPLDKLPK